jgi:hypothetical protein
MSSLWTPGGEHRVPDEREPPAPEQPGGGAESEDVAAAIQAELDEARQRLAAVPAAEVVANHAMGLFELGAIHLSQSPPRLAEASVAIDAMAALVDGLGDRLGSNAPVLRDALAQIRMAFVQVKGKSPAERD